MGRIKRNFFYKLWLFLEILTVKKHLMRVKTNSNEELYLYHKYEELVGELRITS